MNKAMFDFYSLAKIALNNPGTVTVEAILASLLSKVLDIESRLKELEKGELK